MNHVWDNFLKQLVKPIYIVFLMYCSAIFGFLAFDNGVSLLVILLVAVMPWALYGMCCGIIYFGGYLAIRLYQRFFE